MRQRWRLATLQDVEDVASRLRKEDVAEGKAMLGVDPQAWLSFCDLTRTWVIFNKEGLNVALAGVDPLPEDNIALIWMVATDDLLDHQIEFLKYSRPFIEEITAPYDLVFNWVHAENDVHLKWLKWCGFTFIKYHERFGVEGVPFYTFVRITPCVSS